MGTEPEVENALNTQLPPTGHDPTLMSAGVDGATAHLLREMKRTKGVRFNAAKRLEKRDANFTRIIAAASVGVIVTTLLPAFFELPLLITNSISITTVAFSVAILTLTLLQHSANDPVKAEQFHRCALEINTLRREVRATKIDSQEQLLTYSKKYDEILHRYSINHDDVDLERYKIDHPDEFSEKTSKELESAKKSIRNSTKYSDYALATIAVITASIAASSLIFEILSSYLK